VLGGSNKHGVLDPEQVPLPTPAGRGIANNQIPTKDQVGRGGVGTMSMWILGALLLSRVSEKNATAIRTMLKLGKEFQVSTN